MTMMMDDFLKLCESKLAESKDPANALFPMSPEQGSAYLLGRADVLQWVLEMLPPDDFVPGTSLERSQLANCHKEIFRLREELMRFSASPVGS